MSIKRFKAIADNTIVNTFDTNLTTRATGSNSGEADVVEVYSIWGRQQISSSVSTGSQELSRALMKFPTTTISAQRTAGKIPASGSVNFYLRLYEAQHSRTIPKDFKIVVQAVSNDWEEGDGLDLTAYKDITRDHTGSNWINATGDIKGATATVTALSKTAGQANTRTLVVTDIAGNSVTFAIDNSLSTSTATKIAFSGAASDATTFATRIAAAINAANSAGTLNVTAESSDATVTLTQTTKGHAGNENSSLDISGTAISDSCVTVASSGGYHFSGGAGRWKNVGGDYHSDPTYIQHFTGGVGNIELDVTQLVEEWIAGTKDNYGIGIRLSQSYEAYFSHSSGEDSGSWIHNPNGAKKSYYTKRFFARGSQYFFKRPVLEARWDSTRKDDRGQFYFSSSLADHESLSTIYFYNYVRGRLRNVPSVGTGNIFVSLYSGSSDNTGPSGPRLVLYDGERSITGSHVATGIYKCTIGLTKSTTDTLETLYDVWHDNEDDQTEFFTGSIRPRTFTGMVHAREPTYYINITNLRNSYTTKQNARFNLYVREKGWSPTIYTKATEHAEHLIIPSASYRVIRTIDNLEVVAHNTASDFATGLSYDVSGNYFDFDMDLLQPGYEYAFKFAFYDDELSTWDEQEQQFNFRVD